MIRLATTSDAMLVKIGLTYWHVTCIKGVWTNELIADCKNARVAIAYFEAMHGKAKWRNPFLHRM